jgi:glycerate-2-kinase
MDASERFANYSVLTGGANSKARTTALACMAAALDGADTYVGTKRVVSRQGNTLRVGEQAFDLDTIGAVYVVGAGKGSYPICKALDEILGDRISRGVVSVKGTLPPLPHIQVIEGGHPVPNENSFKTGQIILDIAAKLTGKDLVFTCMTGGSSALLVAPQDGMTLQDKIEMNKLLLRTGGPIYDVNTIRKHLSKVKGGGLIKLFQEATNVTLTQMILADFLPWPDTCLPDPSSFADSIQTMKKYDIWDAAPENAKQFLLRGLKDPSLETPKDADFARWRTSMYDVGNPREACLAAVAQAEKMGYNAYILSTKIEGEGRDIGSMFGGIAKEIHTFDRPFRKPCVVVSSGEVTTTLRGNAGRGGPNQETVLGFCRAMRTYKGIAFACIDSEGTDGPTEIAGAIGDGDTVARGMEKGFDLFVTLKEHNASPFFEALNDVLVTGPTGTNVINLRMLVVEKPS